MPNSSSYSGVSAYAQCPRKYWYQYISDFEPLPDQDPTNALILGQTLHTGLEKGLQAAREYYSTQYYLWTDAHETEWMKLECYISLGRTELPAGEHEVSVVVDGTYYGQIDLVTENEDGTVDIWDAKYANPKSIDRYKESGQLPRYAYYYEKMTGKTVRGLRYALFPKIGIRQKKTETLEQFRLRLRDTLRNKTIEYFEAEYDKGKVIDQWETYAEALQDTTYAPNRTKLCDWCPFQLHCETGEDYLMALPKNERRKPTGAERKKAWIYGAPFSGKTTFADGFPDPLVLSTDGNVKFVTAPYVHIRPRIETKGRITEETSAWDVFKETLAELEKGSDFKTIVVDLLEDLHEFGRQHVLKENGWTHETEGGYGAGWKKVESEFLGTIKRLVNLDYNIVIISHEDSTKDLTKKTGDKVSSIKPNIQEKLANKIAGYVDIVGRAKVDDGEHRLSFKTDEVVFGGGRLKLNAEEIDLSYDAFTDIYPNGAPADPEPEPEPEQEDTPDESQEEEQAEVEAPTPEEAAKTEETTPGRRRRARRG